MEGGSWVANRHTDTDSLQAASKITRRPFYSIFILLNSWDEFPQEARTSKRFDVCLDTGCRILQPFKEALMLRRPLGELEQVELPS